MKFGQVPNPEEIDFTIPADRKDNKKVLARSKAKDLNVWVGCAKWNKTDLKGFYPKGVKDELAYYSTHFNCIEMNATFHRNHPAAQFERWRQTAADGFVFCPKVNQSITHYRRINGTEALVDDFVEKISLLGSKLGPTFLQMHNNFGPKDFDRVRAFVENWKYDIPLAIEFRHTDWYNDPDVSSELYDMLEAYGISNVLVDTAGRRDLMHMRLTTPTAFVRWVGANHPTSDRERLDKWVERIASWKEQGLKELYFFVHQNIEKESPLLSAHFIEKLNKKIGTTLSVPKLAG